MSFQNIQKSISFYIIKSNIFLNIKILKFALLVKYFPIVFLESHLGPQDLKIWLSKTVSSTTISLLYLCVQEH